MEIMVTMSPLISHTFFNVTEVTQVIRHHQSKMDHAVSTDLNVTIPVLKVEVELVEVHQPVVNQPVVNHLVEDVDQVLIQQLLGFKNNLISMVEKVHTSKLNSAWTQLAEASDLLLPSKLLLMNTWPVMHKLTQVEHSAKKSSWNTWHMNATSVTGDVN